MHSPMHSPLCISKQKHLSKLFFTLSIIGWGADNTLQTDDSLLNVNEITDGNFKTCMIMSPTTLPYDNIRGNFTVFTSGTPDRFMVQIITKSTNITSCTESRLAHSQQSKYCDIFKQCVLKKECMVVGFCNFECSCADDFCSLHLIDHAGSLQTEWQLCDILVQFESIWLESKNTTCRQNTVL